MQHHPKIDPDFLCGTPGVCTYCGDPGNSIDHCMVPQAAGAVRSRKGLRVRGYGPRTYSCTNCNSRLGTSRFDTFWERCEWLQGRLDRVAKPIEWRQADILALDVSLRDTVRIEQAKRRWARCRADWFQSRDFCINLDSLLWTPMPAEAAAYFASTVAYVAETTKWTT